MIQRTRWVNRLKEGCDSSIIKELAEEYNISETFATILYNRKLENPKDFIMPTFALLNDPYLFEDMEKAVNRIMSAINQNEKITIYGDYDVDGVSATVLLLLFFEKIGYDNVDFYIPDRTAGYGINSNAIREIATNGTKLIISVDCGITSVNEVELAKSLGIDVVITDHHEQAEIIPDAIAVIDPKKNGTTYPFKHLCGAGVAYKLALALSSYFTDKGFTENLSEFYDIVAFATIADLVSLIGENRYIVKEGLKIFNSEELRPAFKKLVEVALRPGDKILSSTIAFQLAPRINALGRVENVTDAVKMFLKDYAHTIDTVCNHCNECNDKRKKIEADMVDKIKSKLPPLEEYSRYTIVDHDPSYHTGVKGIAASKVQNEYNRPIIIFSENGDILEGSCRSIEGFDIKAALDACADCILKYGGHDTAAGVTIEKVRFDEFCEKFENYTRSKITPDLFKPVVYYDAIVSGNDITFQLTEDFALFEPYGEGNASPQLLFQNATLLDINTVGKPTPKHLRLKVQNPFTVPAIYWNMAHIADELKIGDSIDVIFVPSINEWNGKKGVQIVVQDLVVNDVQEKNNPTETMYERVVVSHLVKIGEVLYSYKADDQILLKNENGDRVCLLSKHISHLILEGISKGIFYKIEVNTINKVNGSYEASLKITPNHF